MDDDDDSGGGLSVHLRRWHHSFLSLSRQPLHLCILFLLLPFLSRVQHKTKARGISKAPSHDHVMTHRLCLTILPHRPLMLSLSASPNTSCTPVPIFAEHSMYFAPISRATDIPCSDVTGICPCALSIRRVCSSRRRSILVPTRMSGVPSQKWATSGYHCWMGTTR